MLKAAVRFGLTSLACALLAGSAFAQSGAPGGEVSVSSVRTAGSGCAPRSVAVVIAGAQASILYSAYNATATGNRSMLTRTCNVTIELQVPDGVTVSVASVDWLGVLDLGAGSSASFERRFFFGDTRNVNVTTMFNQPGFSDFLLRDSLSTAAVSGCRGERAVLRANTSLRLMGGGTVSVDTTDVDGAAGVRIGLRLGRC